MYKGLTYGPVLITKGLHKGKIGYFDDTDTDNKLIIYPNMLICRHIVTTIIKSIYRKQHLLFRQKALQSD